MPLMKDTNENLVQAVLAPAIGLTEVITTVAGSAVKTAAALTTAIYRITSTAEVSIVRGNFTGTVAIANDATFPALPHVEFMGVQDGETLSFYDAGAGGATIKISKV